MDDSGSPIWLTNEVPGASDLNAWFGYWPSFHDAEVVSIELPRSGPARISVHTFDCTGEVNQKGQYVCQKHVVVTFLLNGVDGLELSGFNLQNVVSGVTIAKTERGYEVQLEGCYGVEGAVSANSVRVEFVPGPPLDSLYLTEGMPQPPSYGGRWEYWKHSSPFHNP